MQLCSLLTVASSSVAPVSPKPLLGRINRIGRHLTFGRQEDSHDFFLTLLDAIEAELLQLAAGKEAVQDIRTRETTFVYHAFGGYMRNQARDPSRALPSSLASASFSTLLFLTFSCCSCRISSLPMPRPSPQPPLQSLLPFLGRSGFFLMDTMSRHLGLFPVLPFQCLWVLGDAVRTFAQSPWPDQLRPLLFPLLPR